MHWVPTAVSGYLRLASHLLRLLHYEYWELAVLIRRSLLITALFLSLGSAGTHFYVVFLLPINMLSLTEIINFINFNVKGQSVEILFCVFPPAFSQTPHVLYIPLPLGRQSLFLIFVSQKAENVEEMTLGRNGEKWMILRSEKQKERKGIFQKT